MRAAVILYLDKHSHSNKKGSSKDRTNFVQGKGCNIKDIQRAELEQWAVVAAL